jgi:ATP-dependent DNA ligase
MDARWKPMLCTPADLMPEDTDQWVLEPKFDGWRALMVIEPTGVTVIGGRNGKTYNGQVPYIEDALRAALPANTVIDGELIHAAGGWGSVQSVMTTTGGGSGLTFVAFDVLEVNGNDVRAIEWANRRQVLEMIEWPEHTYLTPNGKATAETHVRMLDLGMEGSVVKRRSSPYEGRRSPSWLKLKAIASEDCEIIGFEDGKNGRSGEVGAIVVRLPSGVETTASGMTDAERTDMQANPGNWLGKIVEIVHNGVLDSGKLRHPRYKRLREDRTPVAPPKKPPTGRRGAARMRNYKAMGDAKLRGCVAELEGHYGDAFNRAMNDTNFSADDHLAAAREAARAKGLN